MRSDSLDAILSSIDEKTVGSVLKERKKRMKTAPETEVRKTPEGAPEEYTVIEESKSKNRWKGVLKAVSVTAAVAMIAVFAVLSADIYAGARIDARRYGQTGASEY